MIEKYKVEADLHSHTVASTHAYGTINENAAAARDAGLKILAITDHGPKLPDSGHPWHFYNMRILPDNIYGVRILKGIEANIMDENGRLDLEEIYLKNMEWVIASLHKQTFSVSCADSHTNALVGAASNKYVDVIGHPDAPEYPFDVTAVVTACRENGKFIEMNNSSFRVRKGGEKLRLEVARECMKQGVKVVLSSDAHSPWDIGNTSTSAAFLDSIGFPPELIFNADASNVLKYIDNKKNFDR